MKRKIVYAEDLLNITDSCIKKLQDIEKKLGDDLLINQGLFLMITAFFEDSIRQLMKIVLVAYPEKLTKDSCSISREQLCSIADKGHSIIIDNELYFLFKDGVRSQLEKLLKILFNKEYKNDKKQSTQNSISEYEKESIIRLEEISLFRNALIHNVGKESLELNERVRHFKTQSGQIPALDSELIQKFINEYRNFFRYLNSEINRTFRSRDNLSVIEKTEILWKDCFSSPIMQFNDYWEIDKERDLITGIKYPSCAGSISSSEKILLSIWRHQFDDTIKTEEFLLCSINSYRIFELYVGLDKLKFYHMKEKSNNINN